MEIFSKLGIDGGMLLAQIVNFAILFFVLRRFAYRPVLELLEKRAERIEKGLKDADEARKRLEEASAKEKDILAQAREEARKILDRAEGMSKKNGEKLIQEARAEAQRLMLSAEKELEGEKTRIIAEAKAEIAETVLLATEKVLSEKLDVQKDGELIRKSLKEIA